jgi:hypothetical protein
MERKEINCIERKERNCIERKERNCIERKERNYIERKERNKARWRNKPFQVLLYTKYMDVFLEKLEFSRQREEACMTDNLETSHFKR